MGSSNSRSFSDYEDEEPHSRSFSDYEDEEPQSSVIISPELVEESLDIIVNCISDLELEKPAGKPVGKSVGKKRKNSKLDDAIQRQRDFLNGFVKNSD